MPSTSHVCALQTPRAEGRELFQLGSGDVRVVGLRGVHDHRDFQGAVAATTSCCSGGSEACACSMARLEQLHAVQTSRWGRCYCR